jgi:hypothetical protein
LLRSAGAAGLVFAGLGTRSIGRYETLGSVHLPGDLSITDKIIAEHFVAHAAPITGVGDGEIHGRQALNR